MLQLRYLAQAKNDILNITRYITSESGDEDIAMQFIEKLMDQCRKLAELPGQLGRARTELHEHIRSFPFGNYVIFFLYNNEYLDEVTIIEGHRDFDTRIGIDRPTQLE